MEDGFFYLDFAQSSLSTLIDDEVVSVLKFSKNLFNYPPDIKTLFDVDHLGPKEG